MGPLVLDYIFKANCFCKQEPFKKDLPGAPYALVGLVVASAFNIQTWKIGE